MKAIKNKTYSNFVYVMKRIESKGYDKVEAEKITNNLFDNLNPNGKSMERMIEEILSYDEWLEQCQG